MTSCPHLEQIQVVKPRTKGCEDCSKTGDLWNQLRVCLTCGYVGCCDDSKNQHATKHFQQTQHPLIRSLEPGEHWVWCYPDKMYFDKVPGLSRPRPWSLLTGWLRR